MKECKAAVLALLFVFATLACEDPTADAQVQKPAAAITIPFEAQYDILNLKWTDDFAEKGTAKGQVTTINEASGLANSHTNTRYLWTHEDGGTDNVIFLLNKTKGQVVTTYRLQGAQNIDWEDMAIGGGPQPGVTYIYLADIGDNNAVRSDLAIYRVPEPTYLPSDSGKEIGLSNVEKLNIAYPDSARDAETLLLDPLTNDLLIVTKREDRVRLYQSEFPQSTGTVDTLKYIGSFPFTGIVAGDVSKDGSRILLKSYPAIFYWKKEKDEPLIHLLSKIPERAPYNPVEFQGEAICWDGNSYFTLSEKVAGTIPRLYFYEGR